MNRTTMPLAGAAAALLAAAAQAQTNPPATLPPALVTGNPLGSESIATPSATLSGDGLVLRRAGTLGETLDGLPGVSQTWFGPNANRPIIRGQDGDRIRILANAGATLDASALSFDHAVPIDPLVVERIEVLRGPAALLYGGSAIGGVVNAIDNRIPRAAISGVHGTGEARFGGAARERGLSALVEGGAGGFALHADALERRTDDLRVPGFDHPGGERRDRVRNSASDAGGGALGGSWTWADGHAGVSVDRYENDYGVVVEEEVTIEMKRDRVAFAGEARALGGVIDTVRGHIASTDYEHQEFEGAELGTSFGNRGEDGRVEVVHAGWPLAGGMLRGVFGVQAERSRFDALGAEAFVPATRTRSAAAFVLEQWSTGAWTWSAGVRAERVRVASDGDAPDAAEPRFGVAQERRFSPVSASLGAVLRLGPQWQLTGSLAATQRAPTSYELYANGVHIATAAFERGDTNQSLERGANVDLAVQWSQGASKVKVGAFASRFSNYIALLATGEPDFIDEEGDAFPVQAFQGVRARLHGIEAEGVWRVLDAAPRALDIDARLDLVRADNRSRGEPLPRIAPARLTLGASFVQSQWRVRAEVQHAARQSRVPADDVATPAWTFINASLDRRVNLAGIDALLFVKVANLGDRLAFNAATIRSVRELSPLPGRSVLLGVRAGF